MTTLINYISAQENTITSMQENLALLQQQLQDIQQQLRVSQQLLQAQKSGEKELSQWKKSTEKLLKDLCSIFPKEAFEDIKVEINEMIDGVIESHGEHATSARFLNGSEEEEINDFPELPTGEDTDNPILNLLTPEPEEIVFGVRDEYGLSGKLKHYKSIATKLYEMGINTDEIVVAIADVKRKLERQKTIRHSKQLTLVAG